MNERDGMDGGRDSRRRRAARAGVLAVAALFVLGSRLEYEDELTIFADGSAEHRVLIGQSLEVEEMAAGGDMEVETLDDDDLSADFRGEGVEVLSRRRFTETRADPQGDKVDYEFQEVIARYERLLEAPWFEENTGAIDFERRANGSYSFRRTLVAEAMGEEGQSPDEAMQMRSIISALFPDAYFRFSVELPADISTAGIEGGETTVRPVIEGRRVTWEFPLADVFAATDDFVMTADTVAE